MNLQDLIYNIHRQPDYTLQNESIVVDGEEIIIQFNTRNQKIKFVGVYFSKPVTFKNLDVTGKIDFFQCKFNGKVSFENCHFRIDPNDEFKRGLSFDHCDFRNHQLIVESNCKFESSLSISANTQSEGISIFNSELFQFFLGDQSIRLLQIQNTTLKDYFSISDCTITDLLSVENSAFTTLMLKKNKVSALFLMRMVEYSGSFYIDDNLFEKEISIYPSNSISEKSQLIITNNIFKSECVIDYYKKLKNNILKGGANSINITSNEIEEGLFINGSENPNDIEIYSITVDVGNKFTGLLKIKGFCSTKLLLSGENYKGNVIFKDLLMKEFTIVNLANYSNIQFIKCCAWKADSFFKISESYLDKFQLSGCDFSEFGRYDIENSNLSLIKSSDTKWFGFKQIELSKKIKKVPASIIPKKGKQSEFLKKTNSSLYLQMRDTFRQLKYAMEQQGDKVNALNFKSSEMEAYHQYLKLNHRWYHRDRLILLLGKTNSHGINWQIPLIFILGITLFYYGVMLFEFSPKYYWGGSKLMIAEYLNDYWNYKRILPQLLNPIHKIEDLITNTNFKVSGWTFFNDYFYKVIFAFFGFQLVSSFRKFVK